MIILYFIFCIIFYCKNMKIKKKVLFKKLKIEKNVFINGLKLNIR